MAGARRLSVFHRRIELGLSATALELVFAAPRVVSEGEQRLVDTAFLMNSRPMDTDPLRFEKDMIDTWLRRELPAPPRA